MTRPWGCFFSALPRPRSTMQNKNPLCRGENAAWRNVFRFAQMVAKNIGVLHIFFLVDKPPEGGIMGTER